MITIYKALGAVLLAFYNWTASYGWAILIFGLIVKLIMLPFQMKSKHSMMRTTMLQPRMKELERQYGSNKQKYQEEVTKLYKDAKVNPMSGCLWTLIPFPILIILYKVVRMPLSYLMGLTKDNITVLTDVMTKLGFYTAPAKADAYVEMTLANKLHENFAAIVSNSGLTDFAAKLKDINFDFLGLNMAQKPTLMFWNAEGFKENALPLIIMFLIPFISAGLTILQTKLTQAMNPPQDEKTAQTSKTMNLIMPLMSVYICFIMPVAMGIYWIEQSVFGIIQEAILNKYYKGKLDAEMKEFNEEQAKKDAELARKRAETEKLRAEGKTQVNANTSKKRLAAQEKNAAEQRQAAARAAERAAKGNVEDIPDSQVDNRRYARGRAYVADRFAHEEAEVPAEEAPAEEEAVIVPAETPVTEEAVNEPVTEEAADTPVEEPAQAEAPAAEENKE